MDIKLELDDATIDTSSLCRGCLASYGEMKNLTDWGLAEDFFKTTNIKVTDTDSITQMLCLNCVDILLKCRQWAARCQESDAYLRDTARKKDMGKVSVKEENNIVIQNTISCMLLNNNLTITIMAPDTTSKIPLPCPHSCREAFAKKNSLLLHMIKEHYVDSSFSIEIKYYCSVKNCGYYLHSGKSKFFTGRKSLNQHLTKVHGDNFPCKDCHLNFSTLANFRRHLETCNFIYECQACSCRYKSNERLLVHLLRRHPSLHKQYKEQRKAEKRKSKMDLESKRSKPDPEKFDYICDSPKRSFATQTLDNIKNDVTLTPWPEKTDETKRDEISTQTVFEDLLSLKSNEEDSIFYSETVSLSDIQTQTFPLEFGLSRSNKETITSETQSPDLSLKGTQTCPCLYDSPRSNRFVDMTNPAMNFISTETQTGDQDSMSDLLSFTSIETQTCFDELKDL